VESTFAETDDPWKFEDEVAAALVHKTKLLRLRNWLSSPLLRLPAETVFQIMSYIMEDPKSTPPVWRPIFSLCYRIRATMCATTELWRKADFVSDVVAHFAFERSMGKLQEITIDFEAWAHRHEGFTQIALDHCRDHLVLHGDNLHTVDISGFPSDMAHWSWIFERPLPRLRLKIYFFSSEGNDANRLGNPVGLQLPTDLPLRVLDLRNAKLLWSSSLFAGLTELHLDFSDCNPFVGIPEDELLSIFAASPQLERLSLLDLEPTMPETDDAQLAPTEV